MTSSITGGTYATPENKIFTRLRLLTLASVTALGLWLNVIPMHAQSCTDFTTCNCNATSNPGFCGSCLSRADGAAAGCAFSGACDPVSTANAVLAQCLAGMPPTSPAPPTPSQADISCGIQPESVSRSSPMISRPIAALSSPCTITFVDPVDALQNGNTIIDVPALLATRGVIVALSRRTAQPASYYGSRRGTWGTRST